MRDRNQCDREVWTVCRRAPFKWLNLSRTAYNPAYIRFCSPPHPAKVGARSGFERNYWQLGATMTAMKLVCGSFAAVLHALLRGTFDSGAADSDERIHAQPHAVQASGVCFNIPARWHSPIPDSCST